MKKVLITAAVMALSLGAAAQVKVNVHESAKDQPVIPKEIYGQFAEHLGRCIYDGLWVGEDSDIPNVNGMRTDVVEALKEMKIPCYDPKGSFYCFINISKFGYSSEQFALKLMNEAKVVIIPGTAFGEHGEGYLRLSYAYSLDELKESLNRIESFLSRNKMI